MGFGPKAQPHVLLWPLGAAEKQTSPPNKSALGFRVVVLRAARLFVHSPGHALAGLGV